MNRIQFVNAVRESYTRPLLVPVFATAALFVLNNVDVVSAFNLAKKYSATHTTFNKPFFQKKRKADNKHNYRHILAGLLYVLQEGNFW